MSDATHGSELDRFVVAQIRGQTYLVTWDRDRKPEALRTLGLWAEDPELDFTWTDAAKIARYVQEHIRN